MNPTRGAGVAGTKLSWIGGLLLAAIVILAAALLFRGEQRGDAEPGSAPTPTTATAASAHSAAGQSGLARLVGKWLRPDGGYLLEIRMVAGDGKMDAAYFNPSPINVSRAEASREGGILKVFVELRAVNYPGSTYTLRYDPAKDALEGVYYQAALRESYDVVFVRMPAEELH